MTDLRRARLKAQQAILDAANRYTHRRNGSQRNLFKKHLNEAVCIVRRARLVDNDTLAEAGFNSIREAEVMTDQHHHQGR